MLEGGDLRASPVIPVPSDSGEQPRPGSPSSSATGDEPFAHTDATVGDFWRWAFSDLRTNALRGVLAEYLVALALGVADGARIEWEGYDLTTPDGVKVEVKSSAYLQSWSQAAHSRIVFSGLRARAWTAELGMSKDRTYNADVYVFAVHTCREHQNYDVLDVGQWEFRVLPVEVLKHLGTRSLSYPVLQRHSLGPTPWRDLGAAVAEAARG